MTITGYANQTKVPAYQTRHDIERLVREYNAHDFIVGLRDETIVVAFSTDAYSVIFRLAMPKERDFQLTLSGKPRTAPQIQNALDQEERRLWRALFLALKARFIAVEEGIETFEEAFLSNIITADGRTVGMHVQPQLGSRPAKLQLPPPQG